MKRRVIHPYKILAVTLGALGGGVGCSSSARPDPAPTTPATTAAPSAPAPATPAPAAEVGQRTTPPDDRVDPKLLTLRSELDQRTLDAALAKQDHFRPLCDKDGYPLVGNLNRKGPGPPGATPTAFCAAVRAKKPA